MKNNKSIVKELAVFGIMLAVLFVVKQAFALLPNIELVSFFIILFTIKYGIKTILPVFGFVALEMVIWGFNVWSISYLYIWPLLVLLSLLLKKENNMWLFCVLSGFFGLCFGLLCAIPYIFMGGIGVSVSWWIAGVPWDILHAVSNFIICAILFKPMSKVLSRIN